MKSPSDFPLLDFRFSLHIVYPYALMVTTHGGVITQYLLQMLPAVTTQVILHVVGATAATAHFSQAVRLLRFTAFVFSYMSLPNASSVSMVMTGSSRFSCAEEAESQSSITMTGFSCMLLSSLCFISCPPPVPIRF